MNDVDTFSSGLWFRWKLHLGVTLLSTRFSVNHVVPCNFMLATTHQFQLYLVLNVFNVQRTARGHTSLEGRNDLRRQIGDGFMDPTARRRGSPFNCQESLGDRHGDFAVFKRYDCSVSFDHAQLTGCRCGQSGGVRVFASRCWSSGDVFLFYWLTACLHILGCLWNAFLVEILFFSGNRLWLSFVWFLALNTYIWGFTRPETPR